MVASIRDSIMHERVAELSEGKVVAAADCGAFIGVLGFENKWKIGVTGVWIKISHREHRDPQRAQRRHGGWDYD
jgi:hypothetical protein